MAYIGAGMCALSMTAAAWGVSQVWTTIISIVGRNPQVKKDVDLYAWAGFGASFGPVIIMSLWWKKMTKNGALAGMVTGAVTVIVWNTFGWFGLYEIIPGFIFALAAIVIFSLIGQKPSQAMKDIFDEVQESVRRGRDLTI